MCIWTPRSFLISCLVLALHQQFFPGSDQRWPGWWPNRVIGEQSQPSAFNSQFERITNWWCWLGVSRRILKMFRWIWWFWAILSDFLAKKCKSLRLKKVSKRLQNPSKRLQKPSNAYKSQKLGQMGFWWIWQKPSFSAQFEQKWHAFACCAASSGIA